MAAPLNADELLPLVDALADGQWHSGETLAQSAGITRAALAKRVQKLGDWGLEVEARTHLGYRLGAPVERLDPRRIRAQLSEPALTRLRKLDVAAVADSTNQRLLEAPAADDPQALFAEFQSAGRGRRGRAWVSPFGANIYLSLAWSFPAWPSDLTALPLAVGVACARALRAAGCARAGLKWPNDVLVDGRKLAGILIEHRGEAGGNCRAIIGVGVNLRMSEAQAAGVTQPWTSVEAVLGTPPARNDLAAALLSRLVEAAAAFADGGFAPFVAAWRELDLTRDRPVTIQNGDERFDGLARGVDASGALQVETAGTLRRVLAGDVSLRIA